MISLWPQTNGDYDYANDAVVPALAVDDYDAANNAIPCSVQVSK